MISISIEMEAFFSASFAITVSTLLDIIYQGGPQQIQEAQAEKNMQSKQASFSSGGRSEM